MKITETILSIPPYISTTWDNVVSLHAREEKGGYTLIVLLKNQVQVTVPNLAKKLVDEIFEAHARASEEKKANPLEGPFSFNLPLKPDGPISALGASMQHNPEQADLPPLPDEVLKKITMIARAFGLEDTSLLPKAEPHCNCVYCQLARSLMNEEPLAEIAEEVSDEDLKFRNWDVKQTGDKLYLVTNPLDANEYYNVFLGTPIGCTCACKNCEHIQAVLTT